ncbi:hypothetical protein BKA69DRAFT_505397 [Paraphysoderma sedebokerense]|nr:hypothetical protein BKA69DRAFT_505397 [Paraphysoderma sedebokerense]
MSDFQDIVEQNVTLTNELEQLRGRLKQETEQETSKVQNRQNRLNETESLRAEINSLNDEKSMLKITIETKDRRISELIVKLQEKDLSLGKANDYKIMLEEQMKDAEKRLNRQEEELLKFAQEKCSLIDQIADIQSTFDIKSTRMTKLVTENKTLQIEMNNLKQGLNKIKDIDKIVNVVEESGKGYLDLIKGVKNSMSRLGLVPSTEGRKGETERLLIEDS